MCEEQAVREKRSSHVSKCFFHADWHVRSSTAHRTDNFCQPRSYHGAELCGGPYAVAWSCASKYTTRDSDPRVAVVLSSVLAPWRKPGEETLSTSTCTMALPPGVVYLASSAPYLFAYPLAIYAINILSPGSLQPSLLVLLSLASWPISILFTKLRNNRNAAANGAVLPKKLPDWTPGNILTLKRLVAASKTSYPGASPLNWGNIAR